MSRRTCLSRGGDISSMAGVCHEVHENQGYSPLCCAGATGPAAFLSSLFWIHDDRVDHTKGLSSFYQSFSPPNANILPLSLSLLPTIASVRHR